MREIKILSIILFFVLGLKGESKSKDQGVAAPQVEPSVFPSLEEQRLAYDTFKPIKYGVTFEIKGYRGLDTQKNLEGQNFELTLGYLFANNTTINFSYGRLYKSKKASGGDLADWQYVEENTNVNAFYTTVDIKKFFFDGFSKSKLKGFFTQLTLGIYDAKFEYQYNRYKPYNGFICFLGSCDKTVEESDSASVKSQLPFYRFGGGYIWELRTQRALGAIYLLSGIYYSDNFSNKSYQLIGQNHRSSFNTSDLDTILFNIGLGTIF